MDTKYTISNGAAAAAILAVGIASFAYGLTVCLSHAIKPVEHFFTFSAPVGPLSGKTTAEIVVWLVSWIILGTAWEGRHVSFGKVFSASLLLIALGLLGTFPPFYELL